MSDIKQTQDIEESPGVVSMMRIALKASISLAKIMLAMAFLLCAAMFLTNHYELVTVAVILVTGAPGLVTGLGIAKAWQSQSENREVPCGPQNRDL
jgi:hypothetical protein